MNRIEIARSPAAALGKLLAVIGSIFCAIVLVLPARAQDNSAEKILKTMSDYVASQKSLEVTFDTDVEVITPDIEKIQFASSNKVLLSRPNKLRASRTGGYVDAELFFDGKTLTVFDKETKVYAQVEAPGNIDQLVDRLRDQYSVDMPGADLMLSDAYDVMMDEVLEAKYIGHGVIDGIECDHLAFRNHDTDWQIWIERGEHPIPRKYIITSKAVAAAPQYTLRISDWHTGAEASAEAFAFTPPEEAKKVDFAELPNLDEIPESTLEEGAK